MIWTDEQMQLAFKLRSDGLSASQIATRIGGVTRNAVIGCFHRHGHKFGAAHAPIKKSRKTYHNALRKARASAVSRRQMAQKRSPFTNLSTAPLPPTSQTDIARVSLVDLEPHHCRWPCAEAGHYTKPIYCGEKRVPGVSYCDHHARRAFAATTVSEPRTSVVRTRITNVVKTLVPA